LTSLETRTAVVDAYLIAGQSVDSIRITQSNSYTSSDTLLITLDNLSITINDGEQDYSLDPIGDGYYKNENLLIENDKSYTLQFEHDGKEVSSSTYVPPKREVSLTAEEIELEKITQGSFGGGPGNIGNRPDPVDVVWDNPEGDYYYVLIENIEDNPEDVNELFAQFGINFTFVTQPEITDAHSINARRDLTQFGTYRIVVFRVNAEYVALYESAGSSSQTISEPPNNIDNGLGIFTGVSSDTVFLEVKQQ